MLDAGDLSDLQAHDERRIRSIVEGKQYYEDQLNQLVEGRIARAKSELPGAEKILAELTATEAGRELTRYTFADLQTEAEIALTNNERTKGALNGAQIIAKIREDDRRMTLSPLEQSRSEQQEMILRTIVMGFLSENMARGNIQIDASDLSHLSTYTVPEANYIKHALHYLRVLYSHVTNK